MPLVSLQCVSLCVASRSLFEQVSFSIDVSNRIALIGANGCGKSMALRMIAGEFEPDAGEVMRQSRATIEYVPQELPVGLKDKTLREVLALSAPAYLHDTDLDYFTDRQIQSLNVLPEAKNRLMSSFSGGEVNRILLACALTREPDVILLDEPTNHMDIRAIRELEHFLRNEIPCAFILVSHDRELLDACANKTIILRDGKTYSFNAIPSEARKLLAENDSAAKTKRLGEVREVARLHQSAATLTDWSRRSGNEKFARRSHSITRRIKRIEDDYTFVSKHRSGSVCVKTETRNSPTLLEMKRLCVSSPDGSRLFGVEHLVINESDRIAIVGPNGCGKSTFLKLLVQECAMPQLDSMRVSHGLRVGYYDQNLEHLDREERIYESLAARCGLPRHDVIADLVKAGFPFSRHQERVGALSGGERARLSFAILACMRVHLLILDEPTNHLDIDGIEMLEQQLMASKNSCLFVSHDRRFVERVATRIFVVNEARLSPV